MKIMLLCFGGFSSSLLASKVEKGLRDHGFEAVVTTAPVEAGMAEIASLAAVLVAPQVRHMSKTVQAAGMKAGTPVLEISMQEYSAPDAGPLVNRIMEAMKASQK